MTLYDELQGVVREIMADPDIKQGIVKYIRITPGNGPVDDPGPSVPTPFGINATANGVAIKYVTLGLAQASDLQLLAPVDARYTPDMKDFIECDGIQYKIVQIMPKPAIGTPVAYLFIIRRGAPGRDDRA